MSLGGRALGCLVTEDDRGSPSREVRLAHSVLGAFLVGLLVLSYVAVGSAPIDWRYVALGAVIGAILFYAVGSWILWGVAEWFRFF